MTGQLVETIGEFGSDYNVKKMENKELIVWMCAEHYYDHDLIDSVENTLNINWVYASNSLCNKIVLNRVNDPDPKTCFTLEEALVDVKVTNYLSFESS